jgi:hypothetical protein
LAQHGTYLPSRGEWQTWARAVIWLGALGASFGAIALFFQVAARRIVYPFELEWMEGGSVDHVRRILAGHKLYGAPTLEFIPYVYNPLYFYAAAGVAKVTGSAGFVPLRLLSTLATGTNFLLLFAIARRETKSLACGLAAAALFAATYRLGGAWFDVCRTDSFALAFVLAGVLLCRSGNSLGSAVVAGVLLWAGFLSKQSAFGIGVAACAGTAFLGWRRALTSLVVLVGLTFGSIALLDRMHDGWYRFYCFHVPSLHPLIHERFTTYFTVDWMKNAPMLAVLALAGLFSLARDGKMRTFAFYACLATGTLATVWTVWIRTGSYDNVLMPGHACAALLAAIGIGRAMPTIGRRPHPAVCLAFLAQLGAFQWQAKDQLPDGRDLRLGQELVDLASRQEGDVWIVSHGWYGEMAGKPMHAQWQAMSDVFLDPKVGGELHEQMMEAVRARRFAAIITDMHGRFDELGEGYVRTGSPLSADGFWPRTGWGVRPDQVWVPKP